MNGATNLRDYPRQPNVVIEVIDQNGDIHTARAHETTLTVWQSGSVLLAELNLFQGGNPEPAMHRVLPIRGYTMRAAPDPQPAAPAQ